MSSGYVWNSIIYKGNDTLVEEGNTYQYQETNIVMSLCEKVLDEGKCLFVDNWYSSLMKKSQMLHVDVLCVKNMAPEKKVGMNVYVVM